MIFLSPSGVSTTAIGSPFLTTSPGFTLYSTNLALGPSSSSSFSAGYSSGGLTSNGGKLSNGPMVAKLSSSMVSFSFMPGLRPSSMALTMPGLSATRSTSVPSGLLMVAILSSLCTTSPFLTWYLTNSGSSPTSPFCASLGVGRSVAGSRGRGGNFPVVTRLPSSLLSMGSPGLSWSFTAVTRPSCWASTSVSSPVAVSLTTAIGSPFLTRSPGFAVISTSSCPGFVTSPDFKVLGPVGRAGIGPIVIRF
mmetsp:Transcript_83434/g.193954  ORF Transcript_83434/g.193954 Transcript_83434/m.193954 type:complete len:250 (-) Transcript_83434:473-1222(-)